MSWFCSLFNPKPVKKVTFQIQKEGQAQPHAFRIKSVKKSTPCHWCHQPIVRQGSSCRVCKYTCHTTCEKKVHDSIRDVKEPRNEEFLSQPQSKDPRRFTDTSWQIHRQWSKDGPRLPITPPPPPSHHNTPTTHSITPTSHSITPTSHSITPKSNSVTPSSRDENTPQSAPDLGGGIYDTVRPRCESAPTTPATQHSTMSQVMQRPSSGGRLDLCYVAERILALWLPSRDAHAEAQAAHMLRTKHGDHFTVFEVSSTDARLARAIFSRARSLGWPGDLAPPLETLCSACKLIEKWLAEHPTNVAVLLSWGSRERLGVIVAAYMHYSAICGAAEQALDRYSMRRYLDDRVGPFTLPSNKRYIETFAGLLSGHVRVNSSPLELTHVTVHSGPSNQVSHHFIKIYEGLICVFTSGIYAVPSGTTTWSCLTDGVCLRGDVLLRCYRHPGNGQPSSRENSRKVEWTIQLHTCAAPGVSILLTKQMLDQAVHDNQFPPTGYVELCYTRRGSLALPPIPSCAPLPVISPDTLARYDSLERLRPVSDITDDDPGDPPTSLDGTNCTPERQHTFGPLDGSIYATVVHRASEAPPQQQRPPPQRPPSPPLTASMDSGISSAGRRADELDALLGDMLKTVSNLPDADIPYHARVNSQPFSYTQGPMLRTPNRLASPELVRRIIKPVRDASPERVIRHNRSPEPISKRDSPDYSRRVYNLKPARDYSPLSDDVIDAAVTPRAVQKRLHHEEVTTVRKPVRSDGKWINVDPDWLDRPLVNGKIQTRSEESWRNATWDSRTKDNGTTGLTWLQRQQQKLREKREAKMRAERLPTEWNGATKHIRQSASHRIDGYTSDTTAFADDDDDFSVPLHINISPRVLHTPEPSPMLPNRTSSKKFMFSERTMQREWNGNSNHPGLLSLAEPIGNIDTISRSEASSMRSTPAPLSPRAGTPSFPCPPRTPYPTTHSSRLTPRTPRTPPAIRKERGTSPEVEYRSVSSLGAMSRRSSLEPQDVAADRVMFARNVSEYWYKPNISRDDAISLLNRMEPGSFIVRDSNSFPGAFGLAVRTGDGVRHFLIERTSRGVRLRGGTDEPVFGSLSALLYQHTITPLALPTILKLPDRDPCPANGAAAAAKALLASGAACHVLLLGSHGVEALTGPAALARATRTLLAHTPNAHIVHFKVSSQGITLTDSTRTLFFRRHYPSAALSYCALDPEARTWPYNDDHKRIFGFVARTQIGGSDNVCHVFAELESEQPATAIVNFVVKALLNNNQKKDIV